MVERTASLDAIFGSLSDPIRRDILRRVAHEDLSVSAIARPYDVSLAAISKHLKVLERASLIIKRRRGKHQYVSLLPATFRDADAYFDFYNKIAAERLDSLERFLAEKGQE